MKRTWRIISGTLAALFLMGGFVGYRMLSSPAIAPYQHLQAVAAPSRAAAVNVGFMGTTTLLFDDGKTRILTDGFFSRPSLWRMLLGKIAPDPNSIDSALNKARIGRLDAIFVAHSHHDHAMDSATVAQKTGATIYGSSSTRNVALGDGLPPERFKVFEDGQVFTIGDFRVTVFRTPHSPDVAFPGTIDEPLRAPVKVSDYREGGNYSFLLQRGVASALLVASGNFVPGRFKDVKTRTVFLGIGGLGKQPEQFIADYWREVVQAVGAKVIVPVHWDDFTRSLDEPLQPMPFLLDDFDRSMRSLLVLAKRDGVEVKLPSAFGSLGLD